MYNVEPYYLGGINEEIASGYKERRASDMTSYTELSAYVLEAIQSMPSKFDKLLANVRKESPEHYNYFRSLQRLFYTESYLNAVASSKLVVTPKIIGFGLSLYYRHNKSQDTYEFYKAHLSDPSTEKMSAESRDVTEKMQQLIELSVNKLIPEYIHRAKLEDNGVALIHEGGTVPKVICIKSVMTIPALELLKSKHKMSQLLRGWLNEPKTCMTSKCPHPHIVAYDLTASSGYLSSKELSLKGSAAQNRRYFAMTRRGIIETLGRVGFKIIVQDVDKVGMVRGIMMGVSNVCFDTYIVPALHSIKETNKRYKALKKADDIESFITQTQRKMDDQKNILNYMRQVPYVVEGLMVEPNYLVTRRKLITDGHNTYVYLKPSTLQDVPPLFELDFMRSMGVTYEAAKIILEHTEYDASKNPFTKKMVKELAANGCELTQKQVEDFAHALPTIQKFRKATGYSELIIGRERLWNIEK